MIRHAPVRQSSQIKSVGWDSGLLEVEFHDGQIYRYENVPEVHYRGLLGSFSAGRYFHGNIRNTYPALKPDPQAEEPSAMDVPRATLESAPETRQASVSRPASVLPSSTSASAALYFDDQGMFHAEGVYTQPEGEPAGIFLEDGRLIFRGCTVKAQEGRKLLIQMR